LKISKQKILDLLWNDPIQIGKWVGFNDLTDLHNEWLRGFLYSTEDQTLQGHRGSFKTTTLSLFLSIHTVIKPNETVLFFRKTETDVVEILRQTSNILNSEYMQVIVHTLYNKPLAFTKNSSFEIATNLTTAIRGAPQVVGLGIGTSITGRHADIIVTDDIVNVSDRVSEAERNRTKIAYMELQNVKNRGGRFINTGTPWHKDDCFTLMPNPKKYPWNVTGLITPEQAKEIKSHMTNSLFAANYELKHVADADVIFNGPRTGADPALVEQGISHCDAAYYGDDYTAFTIVSIHDGKYYVFGKCWRKHIDSVMPEIVMLHKKFMCKKLYNELNADKGYVAKQLRDQGLKVVTYTETQNKYIKIVSHLKFVWDDVVFVKGTDQEYIDQICEYNENANHDDCPDSLASLVRAIGGKKDDPAEKNIFL
jgi:predicted phage terminase large subunit-like protein